MKTCMFTVLNCLFLISLAQNYHWDGRTLVLDNGLIKRTIVYSKDSLKFTTRQIVLNKSGKEYIQAESKDFAFTVNGIEMNGFSEWQLVSCTDAKDNYQGAGASISLKNNDIKIEITYLMYPGLPLIRKNIRFVNEGKTDLKIEAVNVEDIRSYFFSTFSILYTNYGRMKHIGSYLGNWNDALVVFHHISNQMSMAIGNEAPGVLKRLSYHLDGTAHIEAGLTHPGQDFPFRKWLKPEESWTSPATFMALQSGSDNGTDLINGTVADYVRKHMGVSLFQSREKPVFVYNTWYPFYAVISDSLVRDLAKAAAECGIQEFVIDDGWEMNYQAKPSAKPWGENYGDWLVNKYKFPNGLKTTFDYIRSLGMKPGLWISIGSATEDAKVFKEHPEWFVKNYKGKLGNLHFVEDDSDFYTSCFGTDYFDYIKEVIVKLSKEYGLAYAKLDLSVVTSAYVDDNMVSGCYANDHPYHRDHEESFIVIYERVLQLFDELHKEVPDLFIDCTFETAGKLHLQDYAFVKHADGNWLANFEERNPTGALRVRQMAWWRSPAMPASSLVIGNQQMDDPEFIFSLKSLIGTLPIALGDPRKLSSEKRAEIKKWSNWILSMQKKYDYMSFRQDLPGFGEPQEGAWDGWMRINTDSREGGIFGVFRQGALEKNRMVFLAGLDPSKKYTVKLAPDNVKVLRASGKVLMEKGFTVSIKRKYDGNIYEVSAE